MTAETGTFVKPIRQTFLVAELKCYLCGAILGTIESEQPSSAGSQVLSGRPAGRIVHFKPAGHSEARAIQDWRGIRCFRCGGPNFLDEADVITRRIDEYNWLDERPRRGRPPKRLVEERRRERELLESQAA